MEFADPLALLLALLAIPLAALSLAGRRGAADVPSAAGLAGAPVSLRLRLARLLPIARVLAVVLLAVALARPRVGDANAVVPAQGIDIALSLDISSSMTSTLGQNPQGATRLDATKQVIRDFIKGRQNDRIGLVVFQKDALALSPPTLDYAALDKMVADLESGLLPDGTGIGVGIATALNMLRDSTAASRIVILLTDGAHNAPSITPQSAAQLAASLHIRVYTIGLVDQRPAEGQKPSDVDEDLLKGIADTTGGRYFLADSSASLADVYDEIGRLETSAVGRDRFEKFTELAPWFLAGAAGLIALDLALGATWLRRAPV